MEHKDRVALIANYCTIVLALMTISSAAIGPIDFLLNHKDLLATFAYPVNSAANPSLSAEGSMGRLLKGTEFEKSDTYAGMSRFWGDDVIGRFFANLSSAIGRWIADSPVPALTFLIGTPLGVCLLIVGAKIRKNERK